MVSFDIYSHLKIICLMLKFVVCSIISNGDSQNMMVSFNQD